MNRVWQLHKRWIQFTKRWSIVVVIFVCTLLVFFCCAFIVMKQGVLYFVGEECRYGLVDEA